MTQSAPILTRSGRFFDSVGRQVILHGINLVNKDRSLGYIGQEGPAQFAAWRGWGLNVLRLGVQWDGLEPQPGVYAEDYLQKIRRQVQWAGEHDLYVILDMHQDLYSRIYADGAPDWATLTDGLPHETSGSVWDDAYYTSPALQTAFDHFWKNTSAPDGIGLQDHYAAAWAWLAENVRDQPAVIGFDLMNEPMPGLAASDIQMAMFSRGAQLLAEQDGLDSASIPDLAAQFLDPAGRIQLFQRMEDVHLFSQIVAAPRSLSESFEREKVLPFYRKVAKAIRSVAPLPILFLETSGFSNFGVGSAVEPILDDLGAPDPQQAFAPHCYDLVTDTDYVAHANPHRVDMIFAHHAVTADRWAWPMLVGEWGAYGLHADTLAAAQVVVEHIEEAQCGDTYWCFQEGLETSACFQAIHRPTPETIAGLLERYHFDPKARTFECDWKEDPFVNQPTRIYIPGWLDLDSAPISLTPAGSTLEVETNSNGAWISIPVSGAACERSLTIQF